MGLDSKTFLGYNPVTIVVLLFLVGLIIYYSSKKCGKEGYRDPIYLNRHKLYNEWYPSANGSIYGPCSHLFSGFAYYDRAY